MATYSYAETGLESFHFFSQCILRNKKAVQKNWLTAWMIHCADLIVH